MTKKGEKNNKSKKKEEKLTKNIFSYYKKA